MRLSIGLTKAYEQAERGSDASTGPMGVTLQQHAVETLYKYSFSRPTRSGKITVAHEGNTTFIEGTWEDKK